MKLMWFLFILLLMLTSWGWATNYYVAKSGSDSNPGTEAQPWRTIQKAADTLTAGDTVYIEAGTYSEQVVPGNSGTSGNYITYTAYNNDTVTIDGTGVSLAGDAEDLRGLLEIIGRSYIKISGLRIRDAGTGDNHNGILVENSSYITIENNYTYNTVSSGIGVWDSSNIFIDNNEVELACNDGEQECISVAVTDTFEVKNCHIHHSGPGTIGGEGICLKDGSSNGKVFNNHVHHLNRLGIYMDAWDKHTYNIEVYGNIVHDINDNDCFTFAAESGGLLENITLYNNIGYNADTLGVTVSLNGDASVKPMKDIFIINNTFYNNGGGGWGGGIGVENPDVQNLVIRNNIVSQNVTFQIEVEPNVSMGNLTVDHNLIDGFRNYSDEIKGNNAVEGDPLFVNASSADFHLQAGSPAIDAGSSTGAPSDDYDGNTRPQGSGYDIGAYEYQSGGGGGEPEISLSRTTISFAALAGSTTTQTSTFSISNSGTGTLNWSVSDNAAWLSVSPSSGTGSGVVTVTMDPSGMSAGSTTGTVTVSSNNASNSPQTVTVGLTVSTSGEDQPPFGQFATPVHGSTVRSSVPVTGWVLDDISVESVKIYRDPVSGEGGGMVYIGDALLVEGARPDIETAYPGYPNNSRAGWGYMMLTNFLPNGGNGTFTLYAVAADNGGHETTLGTKTITCDNANAVKPFGAIDTPVAGGTASGTGYRNGGWVLTPLPNSIPTDGSTINVYVDGVDLGHPSYNIYRSDIASLFPGYSNSNGAHAYLDIDTTAFSDGVHTIAWTAQDSDGNSDGIGSRYFTINNAGIRDQGLGISKQVTGNRRGGPVWPPELSQTKIIDINECERLELPLLPNIRDGYLRVGEHLRPLPIGSTLDRERGIFYWLPGPGFTGNYQFVFITKEESRITVTIKILPGFLEKGASDQ